MHSNLGKLKQLTITFLGKRKLKLCTLVQPDFEKNINVENSRQNFKYLDGHESFFFEKKIIIK